VEPTPTREQAGSAGSRDKGSVYHMIPAQGHVHTKVESAVDSETGVKALVHASDASADGRRKLGQA
jgi:hypothetical protein